MESIDNCGNCRFWRPAWKLKHRTLGESALKQRFEDKTGEDGAIRASERGQCRRHAPRASALTTIWMETKAADWCGEYEAEKQTKAAEKK